MACAESRRISRKAWREQKFQEGFCRVCGKYPRDTGYSSCASCREQHKITLANRVLRSKERGLCLQCHSNPAAPRRTMCDSCNTKRAESSKKRRYNLSDEEYTELFTNPSCCICGSTDNLHIDHCHTKGHVRGLLCISCNHGLGMFKDNIDFLKRAIKYLEEPRGI